MIERASVDEAYLDITDIIEKKLDKISLNELISLLSNTYIVGYSEVGKNDEGIVKIEYIVLISNQQLRYHVSCIMCIIVSEERCQGLKTWILNSFRELHDIQAQKLAIAGVVVEEIRASIYKETGYRCSAGISQNKVANNLSRTHFSLDYTCLPHFNDA